MNANSVAVVTPIFYLYMLSFITRDLGMSREFALGTVITFTLCSALVCPLYGMLSDRIGRLGILMFGAMFTLAYSYPLFLLLETRNPAVMIVAVVVGRCAVFAVQPSYYMDLFEVRLRFSGMVLAREVTGALIGGMLPLLAATTTAAAGGAWWPVAPIMMALSLVTVIALLFSPTGVGAVSRARPQLGADTGTTGMISRTAQGAEGA